MGTPEGENSETLPFPSFDGLVSPQPKFPSHTEPRPSMVIPYSPPRSPPPVTGEFGVPFLPSDGCPFGFSTINVSLEFGVPWTTLLVIQAYPLSSKTRFPGPPNEFLPRPPESFTFTVTVHASGMVTSVGL